MGGKAVAKIGHAQSLRSSWYGTGAALSVYIYYNIIYYTILDYNILHYTILYYTILYSTLLYSTLLYYTLRCTQYAAVTAVGSGA